MLYSELIEMAIHELNMSKVRFAETMGISVTTLYKILKSESVLPSQQLLSKLENLGVDTSALDYNEIYYEYVITKYPEFKWVEDFVEDKVVLRHTKCGNRVSFAIIELGDYRKVKCPYCINVNNVGVELDSNTIREPKSYKKIEPENSLICDDSENKTFKICGNRIVKYYKSTKWNTIVIPEGITEIGKKAFYVCDNLQKIKLPNSIETICEHSFEWCERLQELTIPEGTKEIKAYAFEHCKKLRKVSLPSTLKCIDEKAFGNGFWCLNKANVEISPCNARYKIIDNCFIDCYTNTALGVVNIENITEISVPKGVRRIAPYFNMFQEHIKCVKLPETLEEIGEGAFSGCTALESLLIPANVHKIGINAFAWGTNINSVIVADANIYFVNTGNCITEI